MTRRYYIYALTGGNPLDACFSISEARQSAKMRGEMLMIFSYAFDPSKPSAFIDPKFEELVN